MSSIKSKVGLSVVRYIASVQQSLSAKHTAYYLGFESFIYGFVATISLFFLDLTVASELFFMLMSYLVFSVSTYVVLIARKDSKTPAVAEMNLKTVFILFGISVMPLVFAYSVRDSTLVVFVGIISLLIYLLALQYRNQRYLEVSEFFVNRYSKAYAEWVEASVALEKSLTHADSNRIRSYYWALRAENSYQRAAVADSLELRDIAAEFASASSMVSAAMLASSGYRSMYMNEAYSSLGRAIEKSKDQLCDNCDRQVHIGSIPTHNTSEETDNLCSHCRMSNTSVTEEYRSTSSRDEPDRKSRYGEETSREERQRQERKEKWAEWQKGAHRKGSKNYRKSRSSSSPNSSGNKTEASIEADMSISESCDVLGLSKDEIEDISQVTSAFRRQVKQVHPDAGGSEEAFKRAKQARDSLVKYIE